LNLLCSGRRKYLKLRMTKLFMAGWRGYLRPEADGYLLLAVEAAEGSIVGGMEIEQGGFEFLGRMAVDIEADRAAGLEEAFRETAESLHMGEHGSGVAVPFVDMTDGFVVIQAPLITQSAGFRLAGRDQVLRDSPKIFELSGENGHL